MDLFFIKIVPKSTIINTDVTQPSRKRKRKEEESDTSDKSDDSDNSDDDFDESCSGLLGETARVINKCKKLVRYIRKNWFE
jgi:hypothetical protein